MTSARNVRNEEKLFSGVEIETRGLTRCPTRPPFSFQFLFWRNDLGSVATTSCFCFEKKESTFEVVIVDMARCYWISHVV